MSEFEFTITPAEDFTLNYLQEQPTMQLRWLQTGNIRWPHPEMPTPELKLQQLWQIVEHGQGGGGQRTEWRDVPVETP